MPEVNATQRDRTKAWIRYYAWLGHPVTIIVDESADNKTHPRVWPVHLVARSLVTSRIAGTLPGVLGMEEWDAQRPDPSLPWQT